MRNAKIVADSSANIFSLHSIPFGVAPLKVITDTQEFVDTAALDVESMVSWFDSYGGRSRTSCPNPTDWIETFGDAEEIFCVTITSNLSGSYNSACIAKQMYELEHPQRKVYIVDSLSAGPELLLIIEQLASLLAQDKSFEDICTEIQAYTHTTGLLFMLESLKNLAANGRVSPAIAKITGLLGIRIVGKASDQGTLEPLHKCRGEAKSLSMILSALQQAGLSTGKVRIAHCMNPSAAQTLAQMIHEHLPQTDVEIQKCMGLCSYYAEKGGLLVGFEKF